MNALGWIRAGRWSAYDVVRVALALLLLTTAGLKTDQFARGLVVGSGLLDSRLVGIAAVEVELLLSI